MKRLAVITVLILVMLVSLAFGATAKEKLVIQIWPGSFEKVYNEIVIKPFEEKYNVDVVAATNIEWYTLPKISEEVSSGKPQIDLVQLTVSDFMRGLDMGIWEKLDYNNLPESKNIYERYKSPYGIGFETYQEGLVFNKTSGKPVPTKLEDLWNPKYTVTLAQSHEQYLIPMFNHMLTGHYTPVDLDKIFAKLDELRSHMPTAFTADAHLRTLIANNEVDLAVFFNNRGGLMIDDGMNVQFVTVPSAFVGVDYWGIVKGSPKEELAEKFINFSLAKEQQLANAKRQYLGPTNKEVKLDHDSVVSKGVAYGNQLENALTMKDYKYIAEHLDQWTERWTRWLAGF